MTKGPPPPAATASDPRVGPRVSQYENPSDWMLAMRDGRREQELQLHDVRNTRPSGRGHDVKEVTRARSYLAGYLAREAGKPETRAALRIVLESHSQSWRDALELRAQLDRAHLRINALTEDLAAARRDAEPQPTDELDALEPPRRSWWSWLWS